ncbi:hypothetical protein KEM48_012371 [Puccinia striiformis f. sp. tritici PST-130]|nr:hypothetical protein KEM48_012371 [Puccinia striiformis f. sp. tritici PST-130]
MASRRQPHSQKIGLQKAGSDSDDSDPDENDKDGLDLMMILRRPLPQGKRRLTTPVHLRNCHRPLNMLTSTLGASSPPDNTYSALDKIFLLSSAQMQLNVKVSTVQWTSAHQHSFLGSEPVSSPDHPTPLYFSNSGPILAQIE